MERCINSDNTHTHTHTHNDDDDALLEYNSRLLQYSDSAVSALVTNKLLFKIKHTDN